MNNAKSDAQSLVSIVIPTYNYARFLGAMVQSALTQTHRAVEVVVVDDGSTDETAEVIRSIQCDERLKVHVQENQGCIKAMNKGFELSTGEFVAFCGSDDLFNENHIQALLNGFRDHPDAGLVFDNGEYFRDDSEKMKNRLVIPVEVAKVLAKKQVTLKDVFVDNWITNCTLIVRREVLVKVGLFKPDVYMLGDLHLLYRIAANYPVYFVNYVGTRIRIHGNNMTSVSRHYEYGVRCLEDIRDRYPEVYRQIGSKLFTRKLGRKYYRLGRFYEREGEFEKARKSFKDAIFMRKTRPRYYWSYFRLTGRRALNLFVSDD